MTQCVVLDGWHRGHIVVIPSGAPPTLRLYRPKVVTWCACNIDQIAEPFTHDASVCEYKVCMRSIDGQTAAYSEKGNSDALLKGRDWVQRNDVGILSKPAPLYWNTTLDVDCHDSQAWPRP